MTQVFASGERLADTPPGPPLQGETNMLWFLETLRGEGAALRITGTGDSMGLLVQREDGVGRWVEMCGLSGEKKQSSIEMTASCRTLMHAASANLAI